MIKFEDVRKDVESAIFEALTNACCMEENLVGDVSYYLHGDEETGALYECSGEHTPENVLFVEDFYGEVEEDFYHESRKNEDFMDVIRRLAEQWKERYC